MDNHAASLKEEIGDQEAEQAQPGDDLNRHTGLGLCVCLLHRCRSGRRLAASLSLPQALICESVLQSLDLRIGVGKLGLQLVAGRESAGHSGLGICNGGAGLGRLGGLGLDGLFGKIGGGDRRWLFDGALLRKTNRGSIVVATGGSV